MSQPEEVVIAQPEIKNEEENQKWSPVQNN
jgi:hypothetical protein